MIMTHRQRTFRQSRGKVNLLSGVHYTELSLCYTLTEISCAELCFITEGGCLAEGKIQGIHKRMVRFQKLTRNLFLTLHGHNVHHQQQQLSKFLMR